MANNLVAFSGIPFSQAALAKPKANPDRGYASRLQLCSKGKLIDEGKVRPGSFAIIDGDNVVDLGKEITCIPLVVLDKALDVSGDEVVVAFGKDNPEYQRIAEASKTADSGCMFGPVFLVFETSTCQFLELFLNNKSGRNEADRIAAYLPISEEAAKEYGVPARAPSAVTVNSKLCKSKNGKWTWFAPECGPGPDNLNVETPPTNESIAKACGDFVKQSIVEAEDRDR